MFHVSGPKTFLIWSWKPVSFSSSPLSVAASISLKLHTSGFLAGKNEPWIHAVVQQVNKPSWNKNSLLQPMMNQFTIALDIVAETCLPCS